MHTEKKEPLVLIYRRWETEKMTLFIMVLKKICNQDESFPSLGHRKMGGGESGQI